MPKYASDLSTHPEPPKTREELVYRVRDVLKDPRPRNIGDIADIVRTDTNSVADALNQIHREDHPFG